MRRPVAASIALLVLCAIGGTGAAAASAGQAFLRVNQLGYPSGEAKRAYLMSATPAAGTQFSVRNAAGRTLASGRVGSGLGAWSSAFPYVYPIDFHVRAAGTYTVSADGATSPAFVIGSGRRVYGQALRNALSFYQDERDGPDFIRSPLRTAPAHMNDERAMTYLTPKVDPNTDGFDGDLTPLGKRIDAAGGWWDAGDYLKFVQTASYTDTMLLAGVRDFPQELGSGAGRSDFRAEAKFGARWLLHMWDGRTKTLYYQVGIGEGNDHIIGDHDIWRLPQADDHYHPSNPADRYIRHRPLFRAGPPGSPISPNLAGRDAAAMALAFQVYRNSDPRFAAHCLRAAEHIFALADTTPHGDLLTVLPFDFYPEVEWRDDLELGATELALATAHGRLPGQLPHTQSRFYLRLAAHWAHAYITGPNDADDTLNLYDVSGFAHYDLYRAITMSGPLHGLQVTRRELLGDLRKQLDRALAQGARDPFGFGFPWDTFDTASHGFGLSVMASEYDQLTHSHRYAAASGRWIANVLGANAWGVSLAVGDGSTFPDCMQHQVANIVGSLDGSPPILAGAVVEGPNRTRSSGFVDGMRPCPAGGGDVYAQFNSATARFKDNEQSWSTVEPAIDLTATSPLAFARQAAGLY
jgi:endoglucanase